MKGELRLEGLVRHYRTRAGLVTAVAGVALTLEGGTSLAVVGPSGCGKSTLLGLIGGLERPDKGRVWIGDTELSGLSDDARAQLRRERIGIVFQSPDLIAFLTAAENVLLQASLATSGVSKPDPVQILFKFGLGEHVLKLPDQLSGGQRQRVAIARALANQPELILADEPTGELDYESSQAVIDTLLAAQRESGASLVVVTHDMEVAERMDRVASLRDGRLDGDRPGRMSGEAHAAL